MDKIFIADINVKDEVESVFLLKVANLMEARDGKKYLNLIFTDATGDLEARMWNQNEESAQAFLRNDFVRVKGKMNLFQGRKQFIVQSMEKVSNAEVRMDDFVMKSASAPDEMYQALLNLVNELSDVYIRDLLILILSDLEIARRLKLWPAGKTIHHAYQSGLLEHVLSCANLSKILATHYKVNVNYVVAGAILHDLCKVYELSDGLSVEYTEEGKLVGHLVKGVELVERYSLRIPHFPQSMKLHLKHILLAHHGEYEYGSPKLPQTSEAYLVHLIDLMDSKMSSMEMVKRTDTNVGHWSNFVKHLDRIVYKNELPFFPDYISTPVSDTPVRSKPTESPMTAKIKPAQPLKQNLGKLLGNFKVDEN